MNTILRHTFLSLIGLLYSLVSFDFSLFISFGVAIFIFITLELIDGFGKRIPIRELMSFIVFLQLFISPLITYNYFDNQASFIMYVDQSVYMFYILPALVVFSIGLHLKLNKKNDIIKLINLRSSPNIQRVGTWFVVIGLLFSAVSTFVPPSLAFIIYLLSRLQFVGVFILLFSDNKYRWAWLLVVYGGFALEIVRGGVFVELFVWSGFLYMLLELKWKSSFFRKFFIFLSGILIIYFIQSLKADYRTQIWEQNVQVEREGVFIDIAADKLEEGNVFTETSDFDRFVSRLNTGWIVSKVMEHTPLREPFADGKLLKNDIENVFLPRILFPNKAITGGKANQEKFSRYTGRRLVGNTTMRVGAFADAYINFGVTGGWLCMFFLGLLFNLILNFFYKKSVFQPIYLLWIPFVFAYAIRMSDFQVILNYVFKSIIIVVMINLLFVPKRLTQSDFS